MLSDWSAIQILIYKTDVSLSNITQNAMEKKHTKNKNKGDYASFSCTKTNQCYFAQINIRNYTDLNSHKNDKNVSIK